MQGYTNKGFSWGTSIGREGKGGEAWLTYHLSPREMVQLSFRELEERQGLHSVRYRRTASTFGLVKRIQDQLKKSQPNFSTNEWKRRPRIPAG